VTTIRNDEPTVVDALGREWYVDVLAELVQQSETPLVIGIHGRWGSGKTSMMMQLQDLLDRNDETLTVWFDPWMHQFDENPVLALVQTTIAQLHMERGETVKTLLGAIGMGVADTASSIVGTPDMRNMNEYVNWIEEASFRVREARVELREHFEAFVKQGRTKDGSERPKRLVVFVDDLDRCSPDKVLNLLEALNLYLDVEGCVYILGVDPAPLEAAINHKYAWAKEGYANYLDKIIQLPFRLPPISLDARRKYAKGLLASIEDEVDEKVIAVLTHTVAANPRQGKRFTNTFMFSHLLCRNSAYVGEYVPAVLALLVAIQFRQPRLYDALALNPHRFEELWLHEETLDELGEIEGRADRLYVRYVKSDTALAAAIDESGVSKDTDIRPYIELVTVSIGGRTLELILQDHLEWIRSGGKDGERADLRGADLRGANLGRADLRGADLGRADLGRADLSGADLGRADLSGARLSGADLRGADLRWADLRSADLFGARLSGAGLGGANLSGVELRTVFGIEMTNLHHAVWTRLTQWPDHFDPRKATGRDPEPE
jgi:KAP family P-loop domain/Pentapeptide repeats (8 copies)